eukprot:TRINITY_DN15091_c0_g2_i1.p1 TRINITY_DN15091_c0_g2~~TRINITY_DN15091_c0_g2_i1.p1  ORF type:complete len:182 (+),score=19.69 TRINITY_DN15091_c0_g2_i1:84-548(+)
MAGLPIRRPAIAGTVVDMIIGSFRIQDKTVSAARCMDDLYQVKMRKLVKGVKRPYDESDFDKLIVYVWLHGKPKGMFVIPISELVRHGVASSHGVSKGKMTFYVYPPWREPKSKASRQRNAWQARYYIDDSELVNENGFSNEGISKLLIIFSYT